MFVAPKQMVAKRRAKHTKVKVMFSKSLPSLWAFSLPVQRLLSCPAVKSDRKARVHLKPFLGTGSFHSIFSSLRNKFSYLRNMPTWDMLPAQLITVIFFNFGHSGKWLWVQTHRPQGTAQLAPPISQSSSLLCSSCLVTHVHFYAVELGRKRICREEGERL